MHDIFEAAAEKAYGESNIQKFSDALWGVISGSSGVLLVNDGARSGVAATPLIIDEIDLDLVAHIGWMNADMPTGQVYLRRQQSDTFTGWTLTYCFKVINSWLDMDGPGVLQMVLDMVGGAAVEANWVSEQLVPLGMRRIDPRNKDYFALVISTL